MEAALRALLCREQSRAFTLRGETVMLTLLPARALLALRAAEEEGAEDTLERALHTNAALAAQTLHAGGEALFSSAEEVLDTLSAEEIHAVAAAYCAWSREADPGFGCGKDEIEALKKA